MTNEQWTVLAILGAAVALFVHGRLRVDLVALLVVVALMVAGIATPAQAVSGFGSTVVVTLGALLVVGEALSRTGVAGGCGETILRWSRGREGRIRTLLMLSAAALGSVMSSTAVVALFVPVALRIADDRGFPPSRLLLPLAYAALVSGMLTLIATTANLVVHGELRAQGRPGLHFFDFTPFGAVVLLATLVLFAFGSRWLLPTRKRDCSVPPRPRISELWQRFVPQRGLRRLRLPTMTSLVGRTPREAELGGRHGIRLVGVERPNKALGQSIVLEPSPELRLIAGDVLVAVGTDEHLDAVTSAFGLDRLEEATGQGTIDPGVGVAVVMVAPDSALVGKDLAQSAFRTRHHLDVVGVRRDGQALPDFSRVPLRTGDQLLVLGPWPRLRQLSREPRDYVLLTLPAEFAAQAPERPRLPASLLVLVGMVALSASGLLPTVTCALLAAVAMVLLRCVPLGDVYAGLSWSSIVLVAGMLPLASALDRTGVMALAVDALHDAAGHLGPRALLAVLFVTTTAMSSFVSNHATAVLMAPVALRLAQSLDLPPEPLAMAVALSCSCAFLTPMASSAMTLVYEPGGYRPFDLLRAGLPVFAVTLLVCVFGMPWWFGW